jgi:hypothetical protein
MKRRGANELILKRNDDSTRCTISLKASRQTRDLAVNG